MTSCHKETKQTTLYLYFTTMIISAVRIIVGATYQTGIMHKVSAHLHKYKCKRWKFLSNYFL